MIEKFRKGQIVPRRLRMAMTDLKGAQHCVVFGCDVEVSGRMIVADGGPAIFVQGTSRPRKNGTRQHSGLLIKDVNLMLKEQSQ